MIIVETNLKALEQEIKLLELLIAQGEARYSEVFARGAVSALKWIVEGKELPSTYTRLMQIPHGMEQ